MNKNDIHYSTHCYTCGTELDGKYCEKCGYYVGEEHYRIQVDTNRWGAESLERFLMLFQHLGVLGCSRTFEGEEYKDWNGKKLFWDGDGSDKIKGIKIYPMPMPVNHREDKNAKKLQLHDMRDEIKEN